MTSLVEGPQNRWWAPRPISYKNRRMSNLHFKRNAAWLKWKLIEWKGIKETHKVWLVEKSDRGKAENWCYVVLSFNRLLDLPFNSNSSQCIAKQFFTLRRSSFAYHFTIDAARRASDYSKRIYIFISLLKEILRELIPIICWVITFCTHRQRQLSHTKANKCCCCWLFFFGYLPFTFLRTCNETTRTFTSFTLKSISSKNRTFNFTSNEEFISFLNGSLCVVADETHT